MRECALYKIYRFYARMLILLKSRIDRVSEIGVLALLH